MFSYLKAARVVVWQSSMRFNLLCRESFVLQAQFNSIIWDCSWWQFSLFCSAATVFQWPSCSEQRTEQGLKLPADVQVGGHGVHLWHEAQCRRGIEMSSNNTIQYLLGGNCSHFLWRLLSAFKHHSCARLVIYYHDLEVWAVSCFRFQSIVRCSFWLCLFFLCSSF